MMWKIRNDIKHGGKQKHRWNEAQITQIIIELQKKTDKRERRTVTEIMKWRKKKIDKWVKSRRQEIEEAKIKQEEMKIAMRNFGTQYKIFTVETAEKDTEEKQDDKKTDIQEEMRENKKEPRDRRYRKLKQMKISMMMTRRDEPAEHRAKQEAKQTERRETKQKTKQKEMQKVKAREVAKVKVKGTETQNEKNTQRQT